jgi:hypothetical protein
MSDTNLLPFLLSIQGKKITALLMADGSRGLGVHVMLLAQAKRRLEIRSSLLGSRTHLIVLTVD